MSKHSPVFYSFFIFLTLVIILTIDVYFKINILSENRLNNQMLLLQKAEYSVERIAKFTYENLINTKDIRDLLKDINTNSEEENTIVRDKLYTRLLDSYNNFTTYNIQQLHFHRKNNESFLRFHKPKKFGDNLTNIRSTVKFVNEFQKPAKGFEEGRIFSGYRFVYPLFDNDNNHIGSVEVSSSLLSYKKFLENDKDLSIDFVMDKKIISQKVFDSEKNNYQTYILNSNYAIRNIQLEYDNKNSKDPVHKAEFLKKLSLDTSVENKMKNKETFFLINIINWLPHITSFIPLLNAITNEQVGYIIFIEHNRELMDLFRRYLAELIFFILLSIIIGTFLSTQIKLKEMSKMLYEKYKVILDLTESMVIMYENNKIYNSNHSFLQFFNLTTISDLKHNDITQYFIQRENHEHPTSLEQLKKLLSSKNSFIVFMLHYDTYEIETFEVNIHYVGEENGNFILEFKNITELYAENIELEQKANHDKLTNLHNRHSFEKIFLDKFKIMKKYNTNLSLIMFDIDHFKLINDEYGHNIGDESLKFLSALVSSNIRKEDTLCRWGGEEFIILMNTDLKTSLKTAEHLRSTIYDETEKNEAIPQFSCSFGVVSLNELETITQAIEKVDALLYKSKQNGRNRVSS